MENAWFLMGFRLKSKSPVLYHPSSSVTERSRRGPIIEIIFHDDFQTVPSAKSHISAIHLRTEVQLNERFPSSRLMCVCIFRKKTFSALWWLSIILIISAKIENESHDFVFITVFWWKNNVSYDELSLAGPNGRWVARDTRGRIGKVIDAISETLDWTTLEYREGKAF